MVALSHVYYVFTIMILCVYYVYRVYRIIANHDDLKVWAPLGVHNHVLTMCHGELMIP